VKSPVQLKTPETQLDPNHILALHNALITRRSTLDNLLWQAPVLSLTAQAFLFTIAFDNDVKPLYRVASGLIEIVVGLLSWQLFLRHEAGERKASIDLEAFENSHFGGTVHYRPILPARGVGRVRSRKIWTWCLFFVSLAGLIPILECSGLHLWPETTAETPSSPPTGGSAIAPDAPADTAATAPTTLPDR